MVNPLPSLDDVARLAGVSPATVSRVINASKPVSAATRQRVEASIEQLGYRANALGRSLSRGRSHLLLVLVPELANPYYSEIIAGAAQLARQHGYTLMPVDVEDATPFSPDALEAVYGSLADGVINMLPLQSTQELKRVARPKPWVNCSEFLEHAGIPHVSIDHRQAACDAVQYLINRGHARIGFISSDERFLYARQRREGYEMALRRAGLPLRPDLIQLTGSVSYQSGDRGAAALLASASQPTAVFAVSDTLAIGAIKAFRRAGLRVPQDMAVVGFDDVPIAEVFEPSLTTIAQPMHALGAAAVEMLLEQLTGGHPASRILPYTLKLRETA